MFIFQPFLRDLCAGIACESKKWSRTDEVILYRGQRMTIEDFEWIEQKLGSLISTKSFFSISGQINVAPAFRDGLNLQCHYGDVYRKKGQFDLALKYFQCGYELRRQQRLSDSNPFIASSRNNLGLAYQATHDPYSIDVSLSIVEHVDFAFDLERIHRIEKHLINRNR